MSAGWGTMWVFAAPLKLAGSSPAAIEIDAARLALRENQTACKVEDIPLHYPALTEPSTPTRSAGRLRRE
jgi:hypothetical protein